LVAVVVEVVGHQHRQHRQQYMLEHRLEHMVVVVVEHKLVLVVVHMVEVPLGL